jgi:hypothetical protein
MKKYLSNYSGFKKRLFTQFKLFQTNFFNLKTENNTSNTYNSNRGIHSSLMSNPISVSSCIHSNYDQLSQHLKSEGSDYSEYANIQKTSSTAQILTFY